MTPATPAQPGALIRIADAQSPSGATRTAIVCAWCPDKAAADTYAAAQGLPVSHGICPACRAAHFPRAIPHTPELNRTRPTRRRGLLVAAIVAGIIGAAALLALIGCTGPAAPSSAFYVFKGVEGASNDPVAFPRPLITVRQPLPLPVGKFAVRLDRIGLGYRYTLHQVIAGPLPDGSYIMQGYNRTTNPRPDAERLNADNYYGTAVPIGGDVAVP